ncbi:hypothetical protein BT96DRAFT_818954 [Gymnopus androsaceus JB14]|uniref:BTB domain-containing protein n=1 Tax=Gymnopus androsaceus JB14 TaxID=1447944 RepID=A0A6A4HVD6_9AGAR|nr:hypothetical protein BT96DRAFT_818954 [Gymnopus androsaceus JB14]
MHLPSHEYDPNGDADVILVSSSQSSHLKDVDDDGSSTCPVEFYVHSSVLSLASPLFKGMFCLLSEPGCRQSSPASFPRVPLPELQHVVSLLLRFVYPLPDPEFITLDELVPILAAAVRYEFSNVISSLRRQLLSAKFMEEDPVRVFAIAARFHLDEEAKIASRHTLRISLLDHPLCDDLQQITAHTYHRLLTLHRRRATSAEALLKLPYSIKCPQCNCGHAVYNAPKWWYEFLKRAQKELSLRPTTDVVFGTAFLFDVVAAVGCSTCPGSFLESFKYLEDIKKQIDDLPDTI